VRARSVVASVGLLVAFLFLRPGSVTACSPPFGQATIAALGPAQVVVVGVTGEHVAGGRLFHVTRWFNGPGAVTPIVIAFKEGEATGDCSYPIGAGVPLIIAPDMTDGKLSATLTTLQADPDSELGRTYLAEATSLFGPGAVPAPADVPDPLAAPEVHVPSPDITVVVAFIVIAATTVFGGVVLLARRSQP
jgi:hypothetical protein